METPASNNILFLVMDLGLFLPLILVSAPTTTIYGANIWLTWVFAKLLGLSLSLWPQGAC